MRPLSCLSNAYIIKAILLRQGGWRRDIRIASASRAKDKFGRVISIREWIRTSIVHGNAAQEFLIVEQLVVTAVSLVYFIPNVYLK